MKNFLKSHWIFLLLSFVFLSARIFLNDPWNGAVLTNDTASYVETAASPINTEGFYSGPRSITVPLMYKVFAPPEGYNTTIRSEPSVGISPGLLVLPGFSCVAVFQSVFSIIGWWLLALSIYLKIRNTWLRNLVAGYILLSACMPDIVSWDHVMMSESLSYSLFAIILAASLHVFDASMFQGEIPVRKKILIASVFVIFTFFWINTRDTNAYFVLVFMVFLAPGLLIPWLQRKSQFFPWFGAIILLAITGIYFLHQSSVRHSIRTINPIINNLVANVFPYETRVQFLHEKWGMPDSEDIISITGSANYSGILEKKEFVDWVRNYGMSAYVDFMLDTPLWTTQKLIDSFQELFGYYKQPYYDPYTLNLPLNLRPLIRLINWSSSDLILISLMILIISFILSINRSGNRIPWEITGMIAVLWIGSSVLYAAGYLGETWGSAARHIQNSILIYRLLIVIFLPILLDVHNSTNVKNFGQTAHST